MIGLARGMLKQSALGGCIHHFDFTGVGTSGTVTDKVAGITGTLHEVETNPIVTGKNFGAIYSEKVSTLTLGLALEQSISGYVSVSFWFRRDARFNKVVYGVLPCPTGTDPYDCLFYLHRDSGGNKAYMRRKYAFTLRDTQWHHIVYNKLPNGTIDTYVDLAKFSIAGSPPDSPITHIGSKYIAVSDANSLGGLANVQFYNRPLTSGDVVFLYNAQDAVTL